MTDENTRASLRTQPSDSGLAGELERLATFGGELGTFPIPPELTARILAALRKT